MSLLIVYRASHSRTHTLFITTLNHFFLLSLSLIHYSASLIVDNVILRHTKVGPRVVCEVGWWACKDLVPFWPCS